MLALKEARECVLGGADLVEPGHIVLGLVETQCLSESGFEADAEAGRAWLRDASDSA